MSYRMSIIPKTRFSLQHKQYKIPKTHFFLKLRRKCASPLAGGVELPQHMENSKF